ncbi:TetR family transcriptional regulator [Lentzea guizhouensis]|uniref:TetR family transcriptional regulator n=1 Tax=Lentzea guizhouensis TaxID=1586287 RepID=A0A1B2HQD0_9PSEU|nr:TetR/AcrR family transcriptional regulator C-terminal domain-containing protein [Lentzea guizhouensis]ANZ39902.1 TetR family transcriptional regulator [Lentzea guizhouensis]
MPKGISREKVVAAALELLNEKGMEGVTVRALAARLDVRAPALYWHVRNKQELLDEMSTTVLRRIMEAAPAATTDWRDGLAAYARVLRAEYLRHRDGARIFSGARISDPEVVLLKEPLYQRWTEAGLTLAEADDALDLVVAFVVGFVIEEQERLQSADDDPARYSLPERDAWLGERAPLVKAAGHLRDDGDQRFERHLAMVLDGVSARYDRRTSGTA